MTDKTTRPLDDERSLFEAHFTTEGWREHSFERYNIYDPKDERSYKSRHVSAMWEGWQARAALAQQAAQAAHASADDAKDAERWRWFVDHGFFWRSEHCIQTCWPRHGEIGAKDPSIKKEAIINEAIDAARSAQASQKGESRG